MKKLLELLPKKEKDKPKGAAPAASTFNHPHNIPPEKLKEIMKEAEQSRAADLETVITTEKHSQKARATRAEAKRTRGM